MTLKEDNFYCLVAKLCPTLCDSMDGSLPDSFVHGISQARILEWIAIFFSKGSSRPRDENTEVPRVCDLSEIIKLVARITIRN